MAGIHWAGKFNGKEESLPKREHPEGYKPFKEIQSINMLSLVMNAVSLGIMAVAGYIAYLRGGVWFRNSVSAFVGMIIALVAMVPHEFLHAIWFKEDSYVYHNLSRGMLFVVGTEDMTKGRFVLMSMCPNIVFGFLPFILYLIFPQYGWLAGLGVLSIGAGVADYYNVINALTQMPKGARTYLSGFHSFWYMPGTQKEEPDGN